MREDRSDGPRERRDNPYLGPHTFERRHREYFFGRDREARELAALLATRRLVLFYAESGAGKSSLINARLIPDLEKRGFEVLHSRRVFSPEADRCFEADPDLEVDNVFVFGLMLNLDQSDVHPERFACLKLSDFLPDLIRKEDGEYYYVGAGGEPEAEETEVAVERPEESSVDGKVVPSDGEQSKGPRYVPGTISPRALIIDQFEELFTTHPEAWQAREGFFVQIREAMEEDPFLYVLLAIREDYLAKVSKYAHIPPGELRARYQMERLTPKAALEAVRQPAVQAGKRFVRDEDSGKDLAEELVKNLRQIRPQHVEQGGKELPNDEKIGKELPLAECVEPVQLQVVCFELWEELSNLWKEDSQLARRFPALSADQISWQHLCAISDEDPEDFLGDFVTDALGDFYEDAIRWVLRHPKVQALGAEDSGLAVSERKLRAWFERELITEEQTRDQVPKGDSTTGRKHKLPNTVVDLLVEKHIIRAETRVGTRYELVHDRFIGPIQRANARWREEQLERNPMAQAAKAWKREMEEKGADHAKKRLYVGRQLRDALEAIDLQDADPLVVEFLEVSQVAQKRRETVNRQATLVLVGVALLAIVALILVLSNAAKERAKEAAVREKQIALKERSLRAEGVALQALGFVDGDPARALLLARLAAEIEPTTKVKHALYAAISRQEDPHYAPYSYAYSAHLGDPYPQGLRRVAFPAQANTAVVSTSDGKLFFWDVAKGLQFHRPILVQAQGDVYGLALSGDGLRLVTATGDQEEASAKRHRIVLWAGLSDSRPISVSKTLTQGIGSVWSVAISADGGTLAAGNHDGTVSLWKDLSDEDSEPETLKEVEESGEPETLAEDGEDWIWTVALSPNGSKLASGKVDGRIILWDLRQEPPKPTRLGQHTDWVRAVAFSPDGTRLASASDDGKVQIWNLSEEPPSSIELHGHLDQVWTVAFSPDGEVLASGGDSSDNSIILWHSEDGRMIERLQTDSEGKVVHTAGIEGLAFSGDGQFLLSVGRGGETVVWERREIFSLVQKLDAANEGGQDILPEMYSHELSLSEIPEHVKVAHSNITVTKVIARDDGQWQVSVDDLGTLILWEKMEKDSGEPIPTGGGQISAIGFGPHEGNLLAAAMSVATEDPRIVLWDVSLPHVLGELSLPGVGRIQSLQFTDAGQALLLRDEHGQTLKWDLNLEHWKEGACELAGRNLTYEELGLTATEADYRTLCGGSVHVSVIRARIEEATQHARSCVPENIEKAEAELQEAGRFDPDLLLYLIEEEAQKNIIVHSLGHARACLRVANSLLEEVGEPRLDRDRFVKVWELVVKGQEHSREGQFLEALEALEEALDVDSDFNLDQKPSLALAFHDLMKASQGSDSKTAEEARKKVGELVDSIQIGDSAAAGFGPRNLWSFECKPGEIISISYNATDEDYGASLTLFGPKGDKKDSSVGASDAPGARIDSHILSEEGVYLIEMNRKGNVADYAESTLSLGKVTPAPIRIGERIPYPTEEQTVWSFHGQAGQIVSIAMDTAEPNAYLALFDTNGKELPIPTFDGSGLRIDRYILPYAGQYLIRLGGAHGSVVYGLSVVEIIPRPIAVGESQEADIGTQTLWSFDGEPGQIVSISMDTADALLDPYITLRGPQGAELVSDDDSGGEKNARIESFVLPEAGKYVIEARRTGVSAPYTLTLAQETPLSVSLPAREDMAEEVAWRFIGRKSQRVRIAVEGEVNEVQLTLVGPDGAVITEKAPAILTPPTEPGLHIVVAHGRPTVSGTGWLVMEKVEADTRDIQFGKPVLGELDGLPGDYWTFSGEANAAAVIHVIGKTAGVHLELYGADGARLLDHYSQSSEADWTLLNSMPLTGTYTLVVRGASDDAAGSYALSLDRTDNPVLRGHEGSVYRAGFSPDGSRIVTAGRDGTARVWDAETGEALRTLSGHEGSVYSAGFGPDGSRIVTAGQDGTARVWDAETGECLLILSEHEWSVYGASFSPDGSRIVTAGDDGTAIVWDAKTGKALRTLRGHEWSVYSASYSPDGSHILTASLFGTARVWNAKTIEIPSTLSGQEWWGISVGFSPDGSRIVTAGDDGTAIVWDAETGEALLTLSGHEGLVYSAGFSPDGSRIITASQDGTVRIWHLPSSTGMPSRAARISSPSAGTVTQSIRRASAPTAAASSLPARTARPRVGP